MGCEIYGGGGKPEEEKTVTAGTSVIEVSSSSGKTIKKITVNPTPTETKEVTAGTSDTTVSPSSGKHLSSVTVHPTPTESRNVIAGTSGKTIKPSSGKHIGSIFINPTPSQKKTVTPSPNGGSVTPDAGKLLSEVILDPFELKGQHAWKKSTPSMAYAETITSDRSAIDMEPAGSDIKVYYSSSYTFDEKTGMYTLVGPSYVTISPGKGKTIQSNKYFMLFGASGTRMFKTNALYSTTVYNYTSYIRILPYASYAIEVHDAIRMPYPVDSLEYTVSDNSDAYPDCAIHTDGYLYRNAGRGMHVWAVARKHFIESKRTIDTYKIFQFADSSSGSIKYYTADSYTFDATSGLYTLVNPTEATLSFNNYATIYGTKYIIPFAPSGYKMAQVINPDFYVRLNNWSSSYANKGVFIIPYSTGCIAYTFDENSNLPYGFITSDNENEYPDNVVVDGLAYKKLSYEW